MKNKIPVCELPIMKSHCKTCPFQLNEKGNFKNVNIANEVTNRTLFNSQQICHGTEGKNRNPTHRCKGSYDHNFEIYKRMGLSHLLK